MPTTKGLVAATFLKLSDTRFPIVFLCHFTCTCTLLPSDQTLSTIDHDSDGSTITQHYFLYAIDFVGTKPPPPPSLDPQPSEEQHTYVVYVHHTHKCSSQTPVDHCKSEQHTHTLTSTHMFTTTVVTLSKDRSLWMHATPYNLKRHSPVAYMKLSMPEILLIETLCKK